MSILNKKNVWVESHPSGVKDLNDFELIRRDLTTYQENALYVLSISISSYYYFVSDSGNV